MDWLNRVVDELLSRYPDGEILIESGATPSGSYHIGSLREVVTSDAILLEITRRGRKARHVHFVDDLDALRKIPLNIPESFSKYLGKPVCDIPSPDNSAVSYADYFFTAFHDSAVAIGVDMEVVRSHEKYRSGFFTTAIEQAIEQMDTVKTVLEGVGGRKLDEHWSPIQIMEDGYLKNRQIITIHPEKKTINYMGASGMSQSIDYSNGQVKLDWRMDWPARWWLLGVQAEAFGRDHATKGGSYDTGVVLSQEIFKAKPPLPIPYDFINRAGDTKKMSASRGTGVDASEVVKVLPAEVVRFFMLRYPPSKRLFFDEVKGTTMLMDEFAALAANKQPDESMQQLLYVCTRGVQDRIVSSIPFSHLVACYQAALHDVNTTLEVLGRGEYKNAVEEEGEVIKKELKFIDRWLEHWAPDDVKFELIKSINSNKFDDKQQSYLRELADKIKTAPSDADGEWFHKTIYSFKDSSQMPTQELFSTLYQVLIGKDAGPRAGWFLSVLPRDWLVRRLLFEG